MITRSVAIFVPLVAALITHVMPPEKEMKYSVLAVEYVGDSNKPIPPIVISDTEAGAKYYQEVILNADKRDPVALHVINALLLKRLIAQAELFERSVHGKAEESSRLAKIVSVTIITEEHKKTFSYSAESAISYLANLEQDSRDDESLQSDIVYFQKRISR